MVTVGIAGPTDKRDREETMYILDFLVKGKIIPYKSKIIAPAVGLTSHYAIMWAKWKGWEFQTLTSDLSLPYEQREASMLERLVIDSDKVIVFDSQDKKYLTKFTAFARKHKKPLYGLPYDNRTVFCCD